MADEAETSRYFAVFSHEYPDGPSGPARSYWSIRCGTAERYRTLGDICLHPRDLRGSDPEIYASSICWWLEREFENGRRSKAGEVRRVLGL